MIALKLEFKDEKLKKNSRFLSGQILRKFRAASYVKKIVFLLITIHLLIVRCIPYLYLFVVLDNLQSFVFLLEHDERLYVPVVKSLQLHPKLKNYLF